MSRSFRKGQVVGPAGPGAIVDLGDESFVVMSIDTWRSDKMAPCDLPRLSARLGVSKLKQPMNGDSKNPNSSIGLLRFPRWMFCPSCRHMVRWTDEDERSTDTDKEGGGKPVCTRASCSGSIQLVPMRFVQICEMGHLDDVDWLYWVHRGGHQCQNPEALKFLSLSGKGSGLSSLQIECEQCGCKRGLNELSQMNHTCRSETAFSGGRQPWQRAAHGKPCSMRTTVVQRGDSNVHFSSVVSALDIPDPSRSDSESDPFRNVLENTNFKNAKILAVMLKKNGLPEPQINESIESSFPELHQELGITREKFFELLFEEESSSVGVKKPEVESDPIAVLKSEEFAILSSPGDWSTPVFSGTSYAPSQAEFGVELSRILDGVSLIDRLREVRAMRGFHRVKPSRDGLVTATLDPSVDWLPAHEVFGEGLFLKFNSECLREWSDDLPANEHERLRRLDARIHEQGISFLPTPTAGLIAIHTLSHLLIRQLCFDSGYASSSLTERLYVNGDSYGLLIYTADGDSEGTMGGLVRQGRPDRLPNIFARSLKSGAWCSADPLCSEGENQGMAGLNRAACHACVLVSETSCEYANALLDRRFLVGTGDMHGLFNTYLNEHGII